MEKEKEKEKETLRRRGHRRRAMRCSGEENREQEARCKRRKGKEKESLPRRAASAGGGAVHRRIDVCDAAVAFGYGGASVHVEQYGGGSVL